MPPACLDGIDIDTRAGIAEHKLLRSSILLEHHQFLKDDVVHRDRPSPARFALGDENCSSEKVRVFPLQAENLPTPQPCVKSHGDNGANVISSSRELRKQSLLFVCGNELFATRTLSQQAHRLIGFQAGLT